MYESDNNQALLNMTGLDYQYFSKLLNKFKYKWHTHTFDKTTMFIRKKKRELSNYLMGRPRDLDAFGGLDLVFVWYRTKGPINRTLPLIFAKMHFSGIKLKLPTGMYKSFSR